MSGTCTVVPTGMLPSTRVSAGTLRKVAAPVRRNSISPSRGRSIRLIFKREAFSASFTSVRPKPINTPVSRSVKTMANAVAA
ncbi:hypothetical protein D3C78_1561040 [compost metagenome]